MTRFRALSLTGLAVTAIYACGDDATSSVTVIPPDASADAAPPDTPDASGGSGGMGGSGGSGGSAVPEAGPDLDADASETPDADSGAACADGVLNGNEVDIDCGGSCSSCDAVFTATGNTLAIFELNGDWSDSSGNGRHAIPLEPLPDAGIDAGDPADRFVSTAWGQGLSFVNTDDLERPWGFDWSQYANLLSDTFLIEMVIVPTDATCYQRLFAFLDGQDNGWYLCNGVMAYFGDDFSVGEPLADGGTAAMSIDERHYLAFAVHPALTIDASVQSEVDIYVDGALMGTLGASFLAPPTDAIFFEDFEVGEQFDGIVDAVRISDGNPTASQVIAQWQKIEAQPQ
jgi:hypothetical protein